MYGSKKRLLKSMSTKMIDSKGLLSSYDGTPKPKYDEIGINILLMICFALKYKYDC